MCIHVQLFCYYSTHHRTHMHTLVSYKMLSLHLITLSQLIIWQAVCCFALLTAFSSSVIMFCCLYLDLFFLSVVLDTFTLIHPAEFCPYGLPSRIRKKLNRIQLLTLFSSMLLFVLSAHPKLRRRRMILKANQMEERIETRAAR